MYLTANRELELIYQWFKAHKLTLNTSKTKYILFRKPDMNVDFSHLDLLIENVPIERIGNNCAESSFKFVGVKIDEFLNWKHHLTSLRSKLTSANFVLSKVRNILPENTKLTIYNSLFKSHLDYCNIAWGKSNSNLLSKLQVIQKKAIRNVCNSKANAHVNPLFLKHGLLNVSDMINYNLGKFMYQYTYDLLPKSFQGIFKKLQTHNRNLNYEINLLKSKGLKSIPSNSLIDYWNSLNLETKRSPSLHIFKASLCKFMHSQYNSTCTRPNCFSCA